MKDCKRFTLISWYSIPASAMAIEEPTSLDWKAVHDGEALLVDHERGFIYQGNVCTPFKVRA